MFLPLLLSVQALVNAQPDRMAPVVDPIPHQADVDQLCAHALSHLRHFDAAPPMMGGIDGAQDTDVLHYNLDLEILPGSPNTLIGTNIITVRSLIDGLSTFDIQLHQNFNISAMQVNGVNAAWTRLSVAIVRVTLNPSFNTNDQFDLRVSYNGTPSSGGFGSINFSTQGGSPLIFTLSEPYYAHTWWPVKEDSRDKATGQMAFTVSNALEVASNGTLQGIDVVPGNKLRYRWATNYPTAPYLFSFSATNYNQFSDTWLYSTVDGDIEMPMQFFIYPGSDTPANRTNWLTTKPMLTTFSDLYGVYPFANEKYGIYQFGFGGGMEHQTMTGQGTFSLSVTAHELGHQWWGDMVTCGTWHDIWLNEGFATYSEALWEEFKPGSSGTPALHSAMASRRPSSMNTIVYRYDISSASIIFNTNAVYRKGAWVLHMLRHVVGDTAFFQIINSYGDQFAYATAITDDLQAVAESVYGSSLEWFFEPWIFQTGAPTYQYAWRNISAGGGSYLELFLKQNQDISWPTFSMPVDIVTTTGGSPTTTKVWNDARAEHLLFPVPGTVTALQVDPQNWILHPTSTTTTFLEGPPKIVKMTPAPGSSQSPAAVQSIQIVFHKNVNADAAHFSLNGQTTGSVPFTFAYSAGPMTATLTPNAPLAGDAYTLTVNAAITDALSGLALDGEVAQAASPASLPSGDGLPGGNAVLAFTIVAAPCPADVNASGNVDINDLLAVIGAWGPCSGCAGDVTGDGQVDIDDLLAVIGAWGPCP